MRRTALITGVTGQDGSYLAELLLMKEYQVYGLMRRASVDTTERIDEFKSDRHFHLVEGDITDASNMYRLIDEIKPNEVYNLAAMSHVGASFATPQTTVEIDALGPLNILEAIRHTCPSARFYQASTSELFGDTTKAPQSESTPFRPCSPYAVAKLAAHHLVGLYRKAYSLYACAGILFNHESPRRGTQFVTRKITKYVVELAAALESDKATLDPQGMPLGFPTLRLGNLDARRDWGHARDYVQAMWLMLQQPVPDDFVIATGESHSIRDFLKIAFGLVDLNWVPCVITDESCKRPADVNLLQGDASKAREKLGWEPRTDFRKLVLEMILAELHDKRLTLNAVKIAINRCKRHCTAVSA